MSTTQYAPPLRALGVGEVLDAAFMVVRRLRPRVAGAPERLRPEEFLERLSAAKAPRS